MWEISHETVFGAAHQLRLAPGEGERLHGHNWRIKAVVHARELDSRGFVLDFLTEASARVAGAGRAVRARLPERDSTRSTT